eukprot:gene23863-biopygen5866
MRRRRRRPGENERKIRAIRGKCGRNAAGRNGPGVNSSAASTAAAPPRVAPAAVVDDDDDSEPDFDAVLRAAEKDERGDESSTPTTSTRSATTTARGRRPPRCSSSCASDVQWGGKRCAIRWGRGEGTGKKRLVSYTKYHSGAEGAGRKIGFDTPQSGKIEVATAMARGKNFLGWCCNNPGGG